MQRIDFLLIITLVGALGVGCQNPNGKDKDEQETRIADAAAMYAVVNRIAGYANPQNVAAAGINGTSTNHAANNKTWTSYDGTLEINITTPASDFSTYPQDRTYTITTGAFSDKSSGYVLTGVLEFLATFNTVEEESMSVTNIVMEFSIAVIGGPFKKISSTGITQADSNSEKSGTVVCDESSFDVADLE